MPLNSPRFADNDRLQTAADNHPPLKPGERGEAVQLVQQAFKDLGYAMPNSTNDDGDPDGVYGDETKKVVRQFEADYSLTVDWGVAGKEVLGKLDELFPASPGGDARLVNFTFHQRKILRADIQKAVNQSMKCANMLAAGLRGPSPEISQLLQDTFAIDGSDDTKVAPIRNNFASFPARLQVVQLIHTNRLAPDPHQMGYPAFVEFLFAQPFVNTIYVTDSYFNETDPLERACTLIHELMHLAVNSGGHLGSGDALWLGRMPMNIPYTSAVLNPYCYDRFASWLDGGGKNAMSVQVPPPVD